MEQAAAQAKLARLAHRLNVGCGLPQLVLMTDDDRLHDPGPAAAQLPRGSLVVVRARDPARRAGLAAALAPVARRRGLFLLIADDPALASSADGLHLPERRAGEAAHWRARRPGWLVTVSAHSCGAALKAARCGADAVFMSPIFPTRSHPERKSLTAIRLRLMALRLCVPVYALGGIDARTAQSLAGARLAGLAAIGAFAAAPERAAHMSQL